MLCGTACPHFPISPSHSFILFLLLYLFMDFFFQVPPSTPRPLTLHIHRSGRYPVASETRPGLPSTQVRESHSRLHGIPPPMRRRVPPPRPADAPRILIQIDRSSARPRARFVTPPEEVLQRTTLKPHVQPASSVCALARARNPPRSNPPTTTTKLQGPRLVSGP